MLDVFFHFTSISCCANGDLMWSRRGRESAHTLAVRMFVQISNIMTYPIDEDANAQQITIHLWVAVDKTQKSLCVEEQNEAFNSFRFSLWIFFST